MVSGDAHFEVQCAAHLTVILITLTAALVRAALARAAQPLFCGAIGYVVVERVVGEG